MEKARCLEIQRVRNLTPIEIDCLEEYIKSSGNKVEKRDNCIVDIIGGQFFEMYYDAYCAGIDLFEFQQIVSKYGIYEAQCYIKEELIIKNNEHYKSNRKNGEWLGWAGYEQSFVIEWIEKKRMGTTLKLDEAAMGKIKSILVKRSGKKWELDDVESFVKMIYVHKKIDGGLQIEGLRKSHTKHRQIDAKEDGMLPWVG